MDFRAPPQPSEIGTDADKKKIWAKMGLNSLPRKGRPTIKPSRRGKLGIPQGKKIQHK